MNRIYLLLLFDPPSEVLEIHRRLKDMDSIVDARIILNPDWNLMVTIEVEELSDVGKIIFGEIARFNGLSKMRPIPTYNGHELIRPDERQRYVSYVFLNLESTTATEHLTANLKKSYVADIRFARYRDGNTIVTLTGSNLTDLLSATQELEEIDGVGIIANYDCP